MIKNALFVFLTFALVAPFYDAGAAIACGSDKPNGCDPGQYCETITSTTATTSTCASCSDKTNNKYPNSADGSTSITDCYRGCQAEDIGDSVAAASGKIYKPSGDAAEDKSQCEVVSCKTSGGTCDMGYYKDGNSCKEKATITGTNLTIHGDTTTYVADTTCIDTEHYTFVMKYDTCGATKYGICREKAIPCQGNVQSSVCQGKITGTALLSGSSYNFTSCICEKRASIENGSGSENCHFNSNGTNLTTACTTTVSTCNLGYCSPTGSTCVDVPVGYYYSIGTSPDCKSCPAGATSEAGNTTGKDACHYTADTQFRDNAGIFTLPVGDGIITIKHL